MKFLLSLSLCFICLVAFTQTPGCTDPLASNYNSEATINDGSCTYGTSSISATVTNDLPEIMLETSGLIYWNNKIWTQNDNTDINLYSFDFENVDNYNTHELTGTQNIDQEEISQDSNYIYMGDFGNNVSGNRTNLKILRVEKQSLLDGTPIIDTISFVYSNQTDFTATDANDTDFDCESFIVSIDSIYLFTKQWVSEETSVYSLSKYPGNHIAHYRNTFDVEGLITGAVYNRASSSIVLCGYSSFVQPFIYLLYDFNKDDFFSGNKRKISFSESFHQTEGITTNNWQTFYLSNEKLTQSIITIDPKIHEIDLSTYLSDYLSTLQIDEIDPVFSSSHDDVNLFANENCIAIVPDYRSDIIANDNITSEEQIIIVQSPYPGSYISGENNQIFLRAYDESDNFDEISFNANIVDSIKPIIIAENTNIEIEAETNCSVEIPDLLQTIDFYDNCTSFENLTIIQNPVAGTILEGSENEITISVTDESENTEILALNIAVIDQTPPQIECPNIETVNIDEDRLYYTVIGTELDLTSYTDNCTIETIENDFNNTSSLADSQLPIGTTNVIWTVTDQNDNQTDCSFSVTIHPTDISDFDINNIHIYPNPTNDIVIIEDKESKIIAFQITDIKGKQIISKNEINDFQHIVDLKEFAKGVYLLNIKTKDKDFLKYQIIKN